MRIPMARVWLVTLMPELAAAADAGPDGDAGFDGPADARPDGWPDCPPGEVGYHSGDKCPGFVICQPVPDECLGAEDELGCAAEIWCEWCIEFHTEAGDPEVSCYAEHGVVNCCHSAPESDWPGDNEPPAHDGPRDNGSSAHDRSRGCSCTTGRVPGPVPPLALFLGVLELGVRFRKRRRLLRNQTRPAQPKLRTT